ncbi:MAG: DUF2089 domain-containing protein [Anaerolineae bacterium]|nr:DUF2089 domain-containing protein [Anaerolineae bacterium]
MRKLLEQCPGCGGPMVVTEMVCPRCQTQVRGRYNPCPFCALTGDQLVFLRLFVEKRGNLRDVERELGVSYPTVRGKLEEVAERLAAVSAPVERAGVIASVDPHAEERREILRLVAEGKLSARDALERLRGA